MGLNAGMDKNEANCLGTIDSVLDLGDFLNRSVCAKALLSLMHARCSPGSG